jgi:hypothetical protein
MRGLAAGMNSIELFPRAAVCSWCVHAYSTHSWRRRHLASTAATHGLTNKTRAGPRSRVGDDRRTGVERVGNLVRPRRRTRVLLLPEDAGRRAKQHMRTAQPAAGLPAARPRLDLPPVPHQFVGTCTSHMAASRSRSRSGVIGTRVCKFCAPFARLRATCVHPCSICHSATAHASMFDVP